MAKLWILFQLSIFFFNIRINFAEFILCHLCFFPSLIFFSVLLTVDSIVLSEVFYTVADPEHGGGGGGGGWLTLSSLNLPLSSSSTTSATCSGRR